MIENKQLVALQRMYIVGDSLAKEVGKKQIKEIEGYYSVEIDNNEVISTQRICRYCFKEIEKGDFCSIKCKGKHQSEMRTGKPVSQKVKDTLRESQEYLEKKWKIKKNNQKEFSLKHPNYQKKRGR